MNGMSASLRDVTKAIVKIAEKDGRTAGAAFVAKYALGTNVFVDDIVHEGLQSNVSLIIQRLPWASMIPEFGKDPMIRALFIRIPLDPDSIASEVADELVWAYMTAYDKASRNVILIAVSHRKGL